MPKFEYLPNVNNGQWRDNETGRFASPNEVIKEGEIQITKNGRFKQKGGPFVSEDSLVKRSKEEKPFENVDIAERILIADDDNDIDSIRTYSPTGEQNDKAIVRVGIEKGVISEKEYNEADNVKDAADLIRERSIVHQPNVIQSNPKAIA